MFTVHLKLSTHEVRCATIMLAAIGGHLRRRPTPEIVLCFLLHHLKVVQIVHSTSDNDLAVLGMTYWGTLGGLGIWSQINIRSQFQHF